MLFTYACNAWREMPHLFDVDYAPGKAPDDVACPEHPPAGRNPRTCPRYYGPETMPQIGVDPFRAWDLSPKKESAQAEQQRYVEAPRDRVEARAIEASTGRQYVGDDTSGMTKAAKRGIEREKQRKRDLKKIVAVA